MKKKILITVFGAMVLLSAAVLWESSGDTSQPGPERAPSSTCQAASTAAPTETSKSVFSQVDGYVDTYLNDGTEYAVFLAYPQQSAECYLHNSHAMRSASMIKVFILAATMDKVSLGEASLDEVMTLHASDMVGGAGVLAGYGDGAQLPLREVLRLMITESDNTATNMVIDRIGMDTINSYIKAHGYNDTILQRKMMDMDAINAGRENYSSVKDLGDIFTKIYHHACVNANLDPVMLEFLIGQTDTDCFPAALPGRTIAHKTGALSGLYDDGGIIYQDGKDMILVIMTENYSGESVTIGHMKKFAQAVAG
jgi:beta-lactamase class A